MNDDMMIAQPVIEADGLDLRPLRISDAGLIGMYAADERVAKMTTSIPHPLPPGTTQAFIARAMAPNPHEVIWAMDSSRVGGAELKGIISLKRIDTAQSEIGYWVAPAWWNASVASAAVTALVQANPLADRSIFGSVFQDNPASARVLTKNGFEYVGDAETYSVARAATVATWTYIRKLD
ncbi:N-acetyltransferase [Pseudooceanicola sediminis]|uniref:N-acetyltransferase n=1 Tax=Pseudooceanicola sediminis TaxID=2211117 RepID=A0A399J5G1_9RHOB|nr:GNAT family N-acetyltransferase [Pseudooceanicola sediminis]KAA2316955.1 GNAT family N-acetyltransferase [Puniceibacterium sp. HSS470]RII40594.1 N-acetyltransferase [Pseudooceanicola sediminis]|tara:strand:- start:36277 stop:36816 length:540 start_codon:yes stop_codon:yes gene_type:complete